MWDSTKVVRYTNSVNQNFATDKIVQKNDNKYNLKMSAKKIESLKPQLQEKNTYFARSKKEHVNKADLEKKAKEEREKLMKITEVDMWAEDTFDKKAPYDRSFNPLSKDREVIKKKYDYPITSSSVIGWLAPIDDLDTSNNINSATRHFYDQGHIN